MDTTKATIQEIVWYKKPCGPGKHIEIIGKEFATCMICRTVRRVKWYKTLDKKWSIT